MSHIHIDINNIAFGYDKNIFVFNDFTIHVKEGENLGIIGANGTGKSTLLKLLVGLEMADKGEIRIEDIPVEKGTLSKVREKLGYVFQDSDNQLFMNTVYDDVAFAPRNYGLSQEEVDRRVNAALDKIHITKLKDKPIYKLSGGEKKLASIATILSMSPDIILMDEPSIALDPKNRRNLINILNEFEHMKIIASHDLDFIYDTCNRVILINNGNIVADGETEKVLSNKKLLESNGLELPLSLSRISM